MIEFEELLASKGRIGKHTIPMIVSMEISINSRSRSEVKLEAIEVKNLSSAVPICARGSFIAADLSRNLLRRLTATNNLPKSYFTMGKKNRAPPAPLKKKRAEQDDELDYLTSSLKINLTTTSLAPRCNVVGCARDLEHKDYFTLHPCGHALCCSCMARIAVQRNKCKKYLCCPNNSCSKTVKSHTFSENTKG